MTIEDLNIDAIYRYMQESSEHNLWRIRCVKRIANDFGISVEEAKEAIEVLKEMGLVFENLVESEMSPAGHLEWHKLYVIQK